MEQRLEKGGEKWQGGCLLESHYLTPTLLPTSQKREIGRKERRHWPAFVLCFGVRSGPGKLGPNEQQVASRIIGMMNYWQAVQCHWLFTLTTIAPL